MSFFLCKLWPYLAGGLIGWLLSGWLARKLKYTGASTTVEKLVDNPDHLRRISLLEKENAEIAGLRSQISSFKSASGNATGKTVDNPDHLKRISELEGQLANANQTQSIDIKAAKAAGIQVKGDGDFGVIEGIGPKISEIIHKGNIKTFGALSNTSSTQIQSLLDDAGSKYNMANPGTWPDQASLAANNRWGALKALQDVLDGGVYPDGSSNKTSNSGGSSKPKAPKAPSTPKVDSDAAKAAGFKLKSGADGQHDFTVIEGIGPKINAIIHDANIHTFSALAATSASDIQKLLDNAGSRYSLADPGTWPEQSGMAASNKWADLMKWQDKLDGGKA